MATNLIEEENPLGGEPLLGHNNDQTTAVVMSADTLQQLTDEDQTQISEQPSEESKQIISENQSQTSNIVAVSTNEINDNKVIPVDVVERQSERPNDADKACDLLVANKSTISSPCSTTPQESKPSNVGKKKDDDKLVIYKAVAIKLKKELVKLKDELQKLQSTHANVSNDLKSKLLKAEETLETERVIFANTNATLEATVKSLRLQLESCENDLQTLQSEFENYKTRATQIMQQNNPMQSLLQSNRGFEEERYKNLKQLNDDYKTRLAELSAQLVEINSKNNDLEGEVKILRENCDQIKQKANLQQSFELKCKELARENENLKAALKDSSAKQKQIVSNEVKNERNLNNLVKEQNSIQANDNKDHCCSIDENISDLEQIIDSTQGDNQVSPSGSSSDSYVHIKPEALEIISRSSMLEEAQNQIDNLTKAYLDSENTNSLLSEQVIALKEEIRRIQRGTERMDLANNLEYLKNIVFRFLSLDNSQSEQKQRLVPVLSAVLKLSSDETAKLENIATAQRSSVTSSLFKLS